MRHESDKWRGFFTLIGVLMLSVAAGHFFGWSGPVAIVGAYLVWRVN